MIGRRRRVGLGALLALCVLSALLAVEGRRTALAEDPALPHAPDNNPVILGGLPCDITSPPSHTSGAACYTAPHGNHRRLDHFKQQRRPFWADTGLTQVDSCARDVVNSAAADHGMGAAPPWEPLHDQDSDGWPDPADPDNLRWVFVRTEYPDSGHTVVWHEATTTIENVGPAFQGPTIHESWLSCCGSWVTVASLSARDENVVQNDQGVWQDDLRFRSWSTDSRLGVSRLLNARLVPRGAELDVELTGVAPGVVWITIEVRDLRETLTDLITIGPFTICATGQTPPDCVPDQQCPAGQTGTPPNCVPDPCPVGQTGTPPNCVPVGDPQECTQTGFVWFDEYGGCRPEVCPSGYDRNGDGWCERAVVVVIDPGGPTSHDICQYRPDASICDEEPYCIYGGFIETGCDPEPTCEFGGAYPNCDPPPACQYGGTYPDCDPAPPPTCPVGYSGTPPNCVLTNATQSRPFAYSWD